MINKKVFRTIISPYSVDFSLDQSYQILTLGSCFAEVLASKLEHYKLNGLYQPFGTIFNPISLHKLLRLSLNSQPLSEDFFLKRDNYYFHYELPTRWYTQSKQAFDEKWQALQTKFDNFCKSNSTKCIVLTYGTAWAYQLIHTKQIVANCHKQPSSKFDKYPLSVENIVEDFQETYTLLQQKIRNHKIVLTLSPVRHLKDGFTENSYSKAILRIAIQKIVDLFPNVYYFPAYEILLDDLRDYRFYAEDFLHPNSQATEYIWEYFKNNFISTELKSWFNQWDKISKSLNHRPVNPKSFKHQQFLKRTLIQLQTLNSNFDISQEILQIKSQITEEEQF